MLPNHRVRIALIVALFCVMFLSGCTQHEVAEDIVTSPNPSSSLEEAVRMLQYGSYPLTDVILLFEQSKQEAITESSYAEAEQVIANAWRGIGYAQFLKGEFGLAEEALEAALEYRVTPTPILYNLLGIIAMKQTNFSLAVERFTEGLQLPSIEQSEYQLTKQEMMFNLIVCYERLLDWQAARDAASSYLELFPDDEVVRREYEFLITR